jgi:hypothetical protein
MGVWGRGIPVCCLWGLIKRNCVRGRLLCIVVLVFLVRARRGRVVNSLRRWGRGRVSSLPLIPDWCINWPLQNFVDIGGYLIVVDGSIHLLEAR